MPDSWKKAETLPILKPQRYSLYVNSYRLVSLMNQDYKIFTKFLANRLENILPNILPKLIKEDQYRFIKNRFIADPLRNILNALFCKNMKTLALLKSQLFNAGI